MELEDAAGQHTPQSQQGMLARRPVLQGTSLVDVVKGLRAKREAALALLPEHL